MDNRWKFVNGQLQHLTSGLYVHPYGGTAQADVKLCLYTGMAGYRTGMVCQFISVAESISHRLTLDIQLLTQIAAEVNYPMDQLQPHINNVQRIMESVGRKRRGYLRIAVNSLMKSGKSSLLNAFIGRPLLHVDVTAATSGLTTIRSSEAIQLFHTKDGLGEVVDGAPLVCL
jgi:hypothetical protein